MLYSDFYQKIPGKKTMHSRLKLQGQSWLVFLHPATYLWPFETSNSCGSALKAVGPNPSKLMKTNDKYKFLLTSELSNWNICNVVWLLKPLWFRNHGENFHSCSSHLGCVCCFGWLGIFLWVLLLVFFLIRKYLVLFILFISCLVMELGTRLI